MMMIMIMMGKGNGILPQGSKETTELMRGVQLVEGIVGKRCIVQGGPSRVVLVVREIVWIGIVFFVIIVVVVFVIGQTGRGVGFKFSNQGSLQKRDSSVFW